MYRYQANVYYRIPIMCTQCAIWMLTYSKLQYGSISLDKINIFDGGKWTWLSLFGE